MLKLSQMWVALARGWGGDQEDAGLPHLIRAAGGSGGAAGDEVLHQQAADAMREWQAAQAHFNAVSGVTQPELVDHAIYNLEAAQRKYIYLLRQIQRARGILSPVRRED